MHQFPTGNLDWITIWRIQQNPSYGVTIFLEMGMASSRRDHSEACVQFSAVQSLETMVQVCSQCLCYLYIHLFLYIYLCFFLNGTFPSDGISSMIEMHDSSCFHKMKLKSLSRIPKIMWTFYHSKLKYYIERCSAIHNSKL